MIVSLGVAMLTIAVLGALAVEHRRSALSAALANRAALPAADRTRRSTSAGASVSAQLSQRGLLRGLAVVGVLLLVFSQTRFNAGNASRFWVAWWFAGLALLVLVEWRCSAIPMPERSRAATLWTRQRIEQWRWLLLLPLGLEALYILSETPGRRADDSSLDLVALWMLSIVALVVASGSLPERFSWTGLRERLAARQADILLGGVVLAFAAVPRVFNLSSYSWAMSGDEGTFGVTARSTLEGTLRNPFSSGPWGYPSLLFIIQGWFVDIFGGSVGSARALSALLGAGSVLVVWMLVRVHFGYYPALLTALMCGVMNFHIYWSRDAQDAAAPMFFVPLAFLLLDRGLIGEHRGYSVAAGLTIGFAQFFHPANRLLLPMAIAYLGYALVLRSWSAREISLAVWGTTLANGFWTAAAVIVGHLPLIAYFEAHRVEFWSRTNEVSVFASGWLDREREFTGDSALLIMSRQLWHAIMLPFSTMPHGHYRPGVPLVGWPLVIFVAFGCALATVWFLRRSFFPLALGFWVVTIGLAFTDGPPMTNRYTAAAPFLAALGAIGLWGLACLVIRLFRVPRSAVLVIATLVTLFIVVWNLNFYFHDPNQINLTSDPNTQIANGIAREAEQLGAGTTVYLSGAPRLYYHGFQNIEFIAPLATGVDVDPMWSAGQVAPELTGPTLFAFVPERLDELSVIRGWFPGGVQQEHLLPDGSLLYVSYLVMPQT